jgi:prepilin-type processing-associated H-X9-DG protein
MIMKTKSVSATRPSLRRQAAFTLTDLVAVIVLVALAASFVAYKLTGERARIRACANNLKKLGTAMQEFAGEHKEELPPAAIFTFLPWDVQLKYYLQPGKDNSDSGHDRKEFSAAIKPLFLCPSDHASREIANDATKTTKNPNQNSGGQGHASRSLIPRSYVMSECDVSTVGWPLNSDSATGLGITWDLDSITEVLGNVALEKARLDPDNLPRVKLSLITDPASTLLLTELPAPRNTLGKVHYTTIGNAKGQYRKDNKDSLHSGGLNYLMADGHVEFLTKEQAGGENDKSTGIWTIKKGD